MFSTTLNQLMILITVKNLLISMELIVLYYLAIQASMIHMEILKKYKRLLIKMQGSIIQSMSRVSYNELLQNRTVRTSCECE